MRGLDFKVQMVSPSSLTCIGLRATRAAASGASARRTAWKRWRVRTAAARKRLGCLSSQWLKCEEREGREERVRARHDGSFLTD